MCVCVCVCVCGVAVGAVRPENGPPNRLHSDTVLEGGCLFETMRFFSLFLPYSPIFTHRYDYEKVASIKRNTESISSASRSSSRRDDYRDRDRGRERDRDRDRDRDRSRRSSSSRDDKRSRDRLVGWVCLCLAD